MLRKFLVEIEVDENVFDLSDPEEMDWFKSCALTNVGLFSDEIGDLIGTGGATLIEEEDDGGEL